ncbi:MAG TPA: hypothetical protein VGW38_17790 [Chloroflexota bacterium]|nr:hypothetical protein [Chloroflexota bacterium]
MDEFRSPDIGSLVGQLVDCYHSESVTTAHLRQLVEREDGDNHGDLEDLVTQREALVTDPERLLALVLQRPEELRAGMANQLEQALRGLLEENARLRVTLSASAQEVPRQLARLHRGRIGLGGYQASVIGQSEIADRNG